MPNLVTYFDGTPIFDWCVARSRSKNMCPKDMCFKLLDTKYLELVNHSKFKIDIIYIGG